MLIEWHTGEIDTRRPSAEKVKSRKMYSGAPSCDSTSVQTKMLTPLVPDPAVHDSSGFISPLYLLAMVAQIAISSLDIGRCSTPFEEEIEIAIGAAVAAMTRDVKKSVIFVPSANS